MSEVEGEDQLSVSDGAAGMTAYYNDNDPKACAWLRELIKGGLIADGEVDERSIFDVKGSDLAGFTQTHFFAGIGGWSLALRLAGWPDDRSVWTGSCPCQPFSVAGKGRGEKDERHLWPEFFRLIRECRPVTVFGEQVEGAVGKGWLDGVFGDLEGEGYTCGAAVLGAHSVGAPHIRQRLYWLADASDADRGTGERGAEAGTRPDGERRGRLTGGSEPGGLAFTDGWDTRAERLQRGREYGQQPEDGGTCRLAHSTGREPDGGRRREQRGDAVAQGGDERRDWLAYSVPTGRAEGRTIARRGSSPWSGGVLIPCADGKTRRAPSVESGVLLLADGFWYRMAHVRAEVIAQAMKEIIRYAKTTRTDPGEVVSMVREATCQEEIRRRAAGGPRGVHAEEVLLPLLRDVLSALDRAADSGGSKEESAEADKRMLRDLRNIIEAECASYRRESEEQRTDQPPDSLSVLSQFLARCGQACRDYESRADAAYFPLAGKVTGRVGLLRGAGNAIVPQCAQAFIEAYMSIESTQGGRRSILDGRE